MPSQGTFVIVGAGLAGAKAAETLRSEGFEGRALLLGEEPVPPYERPPLSKEYLRGERGFEQATVHTARFYESKDIELRTSCPVASIDLASREVVLGSGDRVRYDKLLLATGAAPRRLDVPGAGLGGVYYLRNIGDADLLRRAITPSAQVVVIGAGWVGSEVAASARQIGASVALVEQCSVPLERVLGPEVGAIYRDLHAENGVDLHLGTGVKSFEGTAVVESVRLCDGSTLAADVVVVGTGVRPRDELAKQAGLATGDGIAVDRYLASSAPEVFAAGDVAEAFHPRYGVPIRLEHWSAALNQGPVAAKNMLGQQSEYDRTPYVFSDQYDLGMEYRGWAPQFDQVVLRGDTGARRFLAFWLRCGRVAAAMNANIWDAGEAIEALLSAGPVDPQRLADPGTDLAELAQPGVT